VVVDAHTITCLSPVSSEVGTFDVVVTTIGGSATAYQVFTFYASTMASLSPAYANIAGGVDITIEGYNFVTGATITFGGVAVTSSTFIDSEHYVVTIPSHGQGWVDVVMVDPGGASNTLTQAFQYTLFTRGEDIRRQPGITIQDALGAQPNTCAATVDGRSNIPIEGEEFQITDSEDGNRLLFKGTVQSVLTRYEGLTSQLVHDVTAVDFTFTLNKYRPFGRYQSVSATDIVKDLLARYAPDFDRETFVQTNLVRVSFLFDGSQDLASCLSMIAQQIGGGHWYVDYDRKVHFFHVVPPGLFLPANPQSVVNIAAGTAPTVVQGAVIQSTFSYPPGWYFFQVTNVYSNNLESVLGPLSNPVYLDGSHKIDFSNVAVGATVGTFTVSKRRIYMRQMRRQPSNQPFETILRFAQVDDNVTTSFTVDGPSGGSVLNPTSAAVVNIPGTEPLPKQSFAARPEAPPAPALSYTASGGSNGGVFGARVAYVYRDGTVSYASLPSNTLRIYLIAGQGVDHFTITGLVPGPDVNGTPVIARFIQIAIGNPGVVASMEDANTFISTGEPDWSVPNVVYVVGDNTSTTFSTPSAYGVLWPPPASDPLWAVGRTTKFYYNAAQQAAIEPDPVPVWPNPDGPFLEDTDTPALIDDSNVLLLRDPQLEIFRDMSQLRNRVFVKGRGSVTTAAVSIGAASVFVADGNAFSPNGGKVLIDNLTVIEYLTVTGDETTYLLSFAESLPVAVRSGAEICNFLQLDDVEAQKSLGKIERDSSGNVTDGVHEYTVVDTSLRTEFQLYMRAAAELELFARPIIKVRYATRDPLARSGKIQSFDLSNPPLKGDFLIQSVTIDQIHDDSDQLLPRYNVDASSVRYELNDLLLSIIAKGLISGGSSSVGVAATATADAVSSLHTWTTLVKANDEGRISNTTLAIDTELRFSGLAGRRYRVRGSMYGTAPGAADIKYTIGGPTLSRIIAYQLGITNANAFSGPTSPTVYTANPHTTYPTAVAINTSTDEYIWMNMDAVIELAADGVVGFSWAQNTSNPTATTVARGSYLEYIEF
jgi:hypothetical protein